MTPRALRTKKVVAVGKDALIEGVHKAAVDRAEVCKVAAAVALARAEVGERVARAVCPEAAEKHAEEPRSTATRRRRVSC